MQPTICNEGVRKCVIEMLHYYHLDTPELWRGTERYNLMDEMKVLKITLGQMGLFVYVNRVSIYVPLCTGDSAPVLF